MELPATEVLAPLSQKRSMQDFEHVVRLPLCLKLMKGKPGFKEGSEYILWDQVPREQVRYLLKEQATRNRQSKARR